MKSLKSFFEASILDIENTLDYGDVELANRIANADNSDMRKAFDIRLEDKPFEFSSQNKSYHLKIYNPRRSVWIDENSKNAIKETFGNTLDTISIDGIPNIKINDLSDLASNIIAPKFNIISKQISNINIRTEVTKETKTIPSIMIKTMLDSAKIKNCRFEVDNKNNDQGHLYFNGNIPEFSNVKSDTIKKIVITSAENVFIDGIKNNVDIWADPRWEKLFKFNYKITVNDLKNNTKKLVSIKNMLTYRSLIFSKSFKTNDYEEFPYSLNANVKITDFIDVSKFKNLQAININDNKMGIYFFNFNKIVINPLHIFYDSMLKTKSTHNTKDDLLKEIPETSDGWKVIIYKF